MYSVSWGSSLKRLMYVSFDELACWYRTCRYNSRCYMYSIRIMDASVNQYVQFLREICEVWPQNVAMECNLIQNYTWIALANDRIYTMRWSKLIRVEGDFPLYAVNLQREVCLHHRRSCNKLKLESKIYKFWRIPLISTSVISRHVNLFRSFQVHV